MLLDRVPQPRRPLRIGEEGVGSSRSRRRSRGRRRRGCRAPRRSESSSGIDHEQGVDRRPPAPRNTIRCARGSGLRRLALHVGLRTAGEGSARWRTHPVAESRSPDPARSDVVSSAAGRSVAVIGRPLLGVAGAARRAQPAGVYQASRPCCRRWVGGSSAGVRVAVEHAGAETFHRARSRCWGSPRERIWYDGADRRTRTRLRQLRRTPAPAGRSRVTVVASTG